MGANDWARILREGVLFRSARVCLLGFSCGPDSSNENYGHWRNVMLI